MAGLASSSVQSSSMAVGEFLEEKTRTHSRIETYGKEACRQVHSLVKAERIKGQTQHCEGGGLCLREAHSPAQRCTLTTIAIWPEE